MKVEYIDHMGSDLSVVNAARCSFAKQHDEFDDNKDTKLINYLARHGHWCYDDITEILTTSGWKFFKDLQEDDLVAEVNYTNEPFTFNWVKPLKYHKSWYEGDMYLCEGNTINYCVTPNHKMLVQQRRSKGYKNWEITTSDLVYGKDFRVATTAKLNQTGEGTYSLGCLYGFLLADGFLIGNKIGVRLKKERKIQYLEQLLLTLNIEYSKTSNANNVTVFKFYHQLSSKLDSVTNKKLDVDYIQDSSEYLTGIYEGYMQGDGSTKHSQYTYSSSSYNLFNDIALLSTVVGHQVGKVRERHLDNPNHNINYLGTVSSRKLATTRQALQTTVPYKGNVYCVTVPSGMVLVRRKGKQLVCGNTPFAHAFVTMRFKAPIAVHAQCGKHQIGFSMNTVSRRYVSDTPELFLPEFRTKPEGSIKQGSGALHPDNLIIQHDYFEMCTSAIELYEQMILDGVAPEQARFVLPQGVYTEWVWSGSLQAWARFYNQRSDTHAQQEIQELANMVNDITKNLFPVSWVALTKDTK